MSLVLGIAAAAALVNALRLESKYQKAKKAHHDGVDLERRVEEQLRRLRER